MVKKTDIIMDEYIDVLEKIKERIMQAQYQVMTNANVALQGFGKETQPE